MLKKIFSFFIVSIISICSTKMMIYYIKEIDPIMIKIKDNYEKIDAVNASINDNEIVPGKKGLELDVDETYNLMKKYGSYNEDLFVYKEIIPNISINDIYDKYISRGNNKVSLIFILNNSKYLDDIISILNDKDVIGTFFINKDLIYDREILKLLYLNNQEIEYYSDSYKYRDLIHVNRYVSGYTSKSLRYCIDNLYNKSNIDNCSYYRLHMIIPSIVIKNNPLYNIKNNLVDGSIISLSNNNEVVSELRIIINYIRQKNIDIVSLKKLLEE